MTFDRCGDNLSLKRANPRIPNQSVYVIRVLQAVELLTGMIFYGTHDAGRSPGLASAAAGLPR